MINTREVKMERPLNWRVTTIVKKSWKMKKRTILLNSHKKFNSHLSNRQSNNRVLMQEHRNLQEGNLLIRKREWVTK